MGGCDGGGRHLSGGPQLRPKALCALIAPVTLRLVRVPCGFASRPLTPLRTPSCACRRRGPGRTSCRRATARRGSPRGGERGRPPRSPCPAARPPAAPRSATAAPPRADRARCPRAACTSNSFGAPDGDPGTNVRERGILSPSGEQGLCGRYLPLLDILTAIVAAQERGFRLREKMMDPQFIPAHIVDAFVQNAVNVISQYVDPRDLSAALDKLRDLQARVAPPSRGTEE